MAVYTMGPLMAPALGPLVGGYISETVGFRWLFISLTCFGALASLVGVPFLQETYHPILRARLAITSTGDKERANVLIEGANHGLSKRRFLWISLTRPIALMSKSFILNVLSLFMAV
jgi:MFS family permease